MSDTRGTQSRDETGRQGGYGSAKHGTPGYTGGEGQGYGSTGGYGSSSPGRTGDQGGAGTRAGSGGQGSVARGFPAQDHGDHDTGSQAMGGGDETRWERYALAAGGGLLALGGFRRGGLSGAALALAGLGLVWRATTSEQPLPAGMAGMMPRGMMQGRRQGGQPHVPGVDESHGPVTYTHSVTIGRQAQEIYDFWRDFSNLPQFMDHVETIDVRDQRHSHWVVNGPAGTRVEWDAEVTDDVAGQRIGWRSVGDADIHNSGVVEFRPAPAGRGTEVHVTLRYEPPFGAIGRIAAKLTGREPEQQLRHNLRKLKQIMETGEVATVSGQSSGRA